MFTTSTPRVEAGRKTVFVKWQDRTWSPRIIIRPPGRRAMLAGAVVRAPRGKAGSAVSAIFCRVGARGLSPSSRSISAGHRALPSGVDSVPYQRPRLFTASRLNHSL